METIENSKQLPAVGSVNERAVLDFKAADSSDHFEAAKDVAAMANAYGGAILIGAVAHGEVLHGYRPVEAKAAGQTQRKYEEAIRTRCYPRPRVVVAQIELDGGRVVVINVWPFLGQAVGVRLRKDETTSGLEDVYFYPVRVGSTTAAITPEQMHMYLDARFRKTVIALRRSTGQRLWIEGRTEDGGWFGTGVITKVDEDANALELDLDFGEDGMIPYVLPLDDIRAIWRVRSQLKIRISGHLQQVHYFDKTDPEASERVLFIEVAAGQRQRRPTEQRVRVVSMPVAPSLIGKARRTWSRWIQQRRLQRQRVDQSGTS